MSSPKHSRDFITPDSFSVAAELLGRPLARPWRRALAMAIDLLLVALLVALGGGVFLGLVAALFLFRASGRFNAGRIVPRGIRIALRTLAAVLIFIVGLRAWNAVADRVASDDEPSEESAVASNVSFGNVNLDLSFGQGAALARLGFGLRDESNPDRARQRADSLVAMLVRAGATSTNLSALRETAHQMARSDRNHLVREALDSAFARRLTPGNANRDSLARAYVRALQEGASARADSMRPVLGAAWSNEELASLQRELQQAHGRIERQREQIERLQERGNLNVLISAIADELGLGLGWSAVYFTGFLVLMRGQTPGKRLLRVRVVRLDARPIGWWIALERFGGYFASLTLGLLGFVQILWDRNRQGLHDKTVETVVIAN